MTEQAFLDGQILLHSPTGGLSLTFPGPGPATQQRWVPIQAATAGVHYRLGSHPHQLSVAGPDVSFGISENRVTLSCQDEQIRLDWSWSRADEALEGWLEISNQGNSPVQLDRLDVLRISSLDLPAPVSEWRFYQTGWQSWSPAGVRCVGKGPFEASDGQEDGKMNAPHGHGLRSEWVTVLAAGSGMAQGDPGGAMPGEDRYLLAGFVTGTDQLAEVVLEADEQFHSLTAICYADGLELGPGRSLRSDRLRVGVGANGWSLLERWAERVGELMHARVPEKTPSGWCTWYYYFGTNTAQDVYGNLNVIRRHHLPLDVIMVDDGYQAAIGDWLKLKHDRFSDMSSVAATIRRERRVPGIWTAPFGVAADSQTWANHPDWVLRDEDDDPVFAWSHAGQPVYALDLTHPEVSDWIHTTFRTMRHEWGYEAFKVDFLFAAALPGRRHDPEVTRAQAVRRGLEVIRDAVGQEAFVLGCGAPLLPAVGLADAMRIGPDVSPAWAPARGDNPSAPAASNALRNSIARAFTHRRLWAADPDCLLARPRGETSQLTVYETRTLATVLVLTGGMLFDSDQVRDLPPSRLAMLRQTLPPTDEIARPFDLFEHELPEVLVLPVEKPWGHWWLAARINWSGQGRVLSSTLADLGLPPGRYHVYDQWRAEYLGQVDSELPPLPQRPHETSLLLFRPAADQPDWLTSTFHLAAGTVEVVDVIRQKLGDQRQKLVVHLEQRGENFGRLVFTLPKGWIVLDAQVNGRRRSVNIRSRQVGLVDMGFTLRDRAWALLDCARVSGRVA
jgi:alpha-galactosidase